MKAAPDHTEKHVCGYVPIELCLLGKVAIWVDRSCHSLLTLEMEDGQPEDRSVSSLQSFSLKVVSWTIS